MGYTTNTFLLTNFSPTVGSEYFLITSIWYSIFIKNTFALFSDMVTPIGRQNIDPFTSWDYDSKQMEAWDILFMVFLCNYDTYLDTYKMEDLLKDRDVSKTRSTNRKNVNPHSLTPSCSNFIQI